MAFFKCVFNCILAGQKFTQHIIYRDAMVTNRPGPRPVCFPDQAEQVRFRWYGSFLKALVSEGALGMRPVPVY